MKKKVKFNDGLKDVLLAIAVSLAIAGWIIFFFVGVAHRDRINELQADVAALEDTKRLFWQQERNISANDVMYIHRQIKRNCPSGRHWIEHRHIPLCEIIDSFLEHLDVKIIPKMTTTKREPLRLEKRE